MRSGSFCDGQCARTRPSLCGEICRRLEDPTESASAAYRRAGTRTRRETSPCAPQCKPVEVGRRDRLPRRARLRRLLRALRRVHESTTDGARRPTSSRRTYFDRGLALKAHEAVPTISGCCGGRHHLYHKTCEARRASLGSVDVPRHADGFGVVFGTAGVASDAPAGFAKIDHFHGR